MTKNAAGFTLFEIIAVLVLSGIIALFSSMFLSSGINMFLFSRNNSESALKTEVALNRIGLELKNINNVVITPNISISYENENLPGSRAICFDSSDKKIILTVDRKSYTLLDHVTSLKLSGSKDDLNDDDLDDLACIEIEITFEVNDVSKKFNTKIYPRISL